MEEALGAASDVPSNYQQLSYFVSFTVPQQKIRIRIPELVAKTMERKFSGHSKVVELEVVQDIHVVDESKSEKRKRDKTGTRNLLLKRFYSIFSKVFGATFLSEGKYGKGKRDGNQGKGVEPKSRIFDFSDEFRNDLAYENNDQPFALNGHGGKQHRHDDKKVQNMDPLKWLDKHLLEKKNRWNLQEKMNKENEKPNLCTTRNGKGVAATNNFTFASSFRLIKQENGFRLHKVRSRILTTGGKLKMPRSLQRRFKKHYSDGEEGEDGDDQRRYGNVELCRKRILMGGRCKPLNFSGTLMYDKNGCLIPEAIP